MGLVAVSELKPTMVLADDLRDRSGRLLIGKGTHLTEKNIKVCKIWGVIEADIEGISQEEISSQRMKQFDPETLEAVEQVVRKRFIHNDLNHPAIRELLRICTLDKVKQKLPLKEHESEEIKHQKHHEGKEETKPVDIHPEKFISENTQLSTLPDIFRQINETISKPNSSAHDIAKVISKDPNLSAKLLKIVNSAFYGYPSRIDTLSRAVNIVGTKQLSTLAIGVNVINLFRNIPSVIVDMKAFWQHSVACGINARIIAGYKNIQNTERLFVAGLLHDIGRLLMYNYIPDMSREMLISARVRKKLLFAVERDFLGIDHSYIGGLLLAKWRLPMSLENTVAHHHDPGKSQNRLESAIVHLADIMANASGKGSSGERLLPLLNQEAWDLIGLSPNVLGLTMDHSDNQLEDIFEFFFTDEN
jgi:HD-like signal output (HDOD) protein